MSTNKDLFKEAIADAKQVREAALVNAKAALEEALGPQLQSMISAKLQEMENDEEVKEGFYPDETSDKIQDKYRATGAALEETEELEEDFDLSEILAELDAEKEEKGEEKMEEAYDEEKMEEAETEEETEEEEIEDEESEEESEEGDKITDLTVDQLKDIIKDIISSELEAEEYETPGEEEAEMVDNEEEMGLEMGTEEPAEDEDLNLEELLAELDALDEVEETESLNESAIADVLTALAGVAGMGLTSAAIMKAQDLLKQKNPELYSKLQNVRTSMSKQGVGMDMEEAKKEKDEMKEAIETIETLRAELHEQNLLNAKLLYVNKIFKAKNLSESQKLKVIASFDKATTPKQAKELFESIQSSTLGASKKSSIKESLGFASKAAGVAPKSTIVESNDVIARMQKLANIIK
jgi:hypothetical protein